MHLCSYTQSKITPSVVVTPLVKDSPATNLSPGKDDSFHTPMVKEGSMLSASLRAGAFDTNAAVLLTCSLPDLRSLFSTSPQVTPQTADEGATLDNQETSEEGNEGEEGDRESEQEPVSKEESEEECPGDDGDDTVFKEDESEEEVWLSSDDEDIHQLVQTLQSYVEESSMYQPLTHTNLMCMHFPTSESPGTSQSGSHRMTSGVIESSSQGISPPPLSEDWEESGNCLLYTSPSPRDATLSRMPSSA